MINFDKKDVITALNREEAEIYIGEKGYYCYRNNDWRPCELVRVYLKDDDFDVRNVFTILDHKTEHECPMFLPADKVKEVEEPKKYRPFKSIDEFKKETGLDLLSIVHYRYITEKPKTITTIGFGVITDFNTCIDENYYITIGDISFNLDELFNYEYLDKQGEWLPFGVLDES